MALRSFFFALILTPYANVSLACQQGYEQDYDPFPSPTLVVLTAKVLSVDIVSPSEDIACTRVKYSTTETLFGTVPPILHVQTCPKDTSAEELSKTFADHDFVTNVGAIAGADVIIGIIKEDNDKYRYAIPSCMGAFHVRLDNMDEDQKIQLISHIKQDLAE